MKTCTLDTCEKKHHGDGYCANHLRAFNRYGTATPTDEQRRAMRKKPEPTAPKPFRLCSVPDCGRKHKAKDLCRSHYMRTFYTGDARPGDPIAAIDPDPLRRMATHLMPGGDEHPYCWVWTGTRDKDGYGRIWVDGRVIQAHRRMYELLTGEQLADDVERDHICQNKACVNPAHGQSVSRGEHSRLTRERIKRSKAEGVTFTAVRHTLNPEQWLFGMEYGLPVEFGGVRLLAAAA